MEETEVLKGQILTVEVDVTNYGETDASRCVFTDILHDGITYVPGSAKINGSAAGTLATYTAGTGTLRINFGTGATVGTAVTNGGVVKGTNSMGTTATTVVGEKVTLSFQVTVTGNPGTVVTNQARVDYNDLNYETYNPSGLISYSCVTGKINTNGTTEGTDDTIDTTEITNYINRFTIIAREVYGDGVVWIDNDMDGNIAATGERLVSGHTVSLIDISTGAVALDANGNPCITTTDGNGNYNFIALNIGTYRVEIDVPAGYKVTPRRDAAAITITTTVAATQGSPHNNASQSGTKAISGNFAFPASTGGYEYYVHNMDFGLIPDITVKKELYVNGSLAANGTFVKPGDALRYVITLTNNAANAADVLKLAGNGTAWMIEDGLPEGFTYASLSPTTGGSYDSGTHTVHWAAMDLPKGDTVFSVTGTAADLPGKLGNVAQFDQGGGLPPVPTEETVHYITVRRITGTVWLDVDENGNIGLPAQETRMASLTVKLLDAATGTQVQTTTTDADGNYTFNVVNPGTYKVVVDLGTEYGVTLLNTTVAVTTNTPGVQTTPNNNAVLSGTQAVIGTLTMDGAFSATHYAYYASFADIGLIEQNRTLTLEKRVTGASGDLTKGFTFTLTLTRSDNTAITTPVSYTGVSTVAGVAAPAGGTLTGGTATVTLKHGQSIVISGLPGGAKYSIAEAAASGYTTTSQIINENPATTTNTGTTNGASASGQLVSDGAKVLYVNNANPITPTGIWMDIGPYALIVLLAGLGMLGLTLLRRRNQPDNGGL